MNQRLRIRTLLRWVVLSFTLVCESNASTESEHETSLQWMQESLTTVPRWDAWQKQTGELPPDFDALPSYPLLPDPLLFFDGRPVNTVNDWRERRQEILESYQHYLLGRFPPKPKLDRVILIESSVADGYSTRIVRLEFGPGSRATLRVQITTPNGPGPFPTVITPSLGGWVSHLIPRGYAAVGFAGNDFMDDTAILEELYPDYDFAALPRRAWAVQMVMDYLQTLPEIDMSHVAIYGYSRDGKMTTLAAAFDERISALIAGSTGVGGVLPWRLSGESGMGESIESTMMMFPDWFHPRLRFFAGHEDRLPVDGNLLVAAIAPRACLMQYGLNDEVSNVWGNEQSYASALRVYQLLGHPERLGLLREAGFHGSIDPEKCLDWLDIQFGRTSGKTWHNDRLFAWDFDTWKERHEHDFDVTRFPEHNPNQSLLDENGATFQTVSAWETKATQIRKTVREMLGKTPPQPPDPIPFFRRNTGPVPGPTHAQGKGPGQLEPDVPAWVIGRSIQEFGWVDADNKTVDSVRLRFGRGLHGDLFFPKNHPPGKPLQTVVWLHGYSYPLGYMWVYRRDLHPILALVQAGYAVFAFDQCGFGYRQDEAGSFYDRYPDWSRLGRMISDVSTAVDVLEKQEQVDPGRIYALGYTLGGMVGLHAAALDPRIQGVISVAGFSPFRTDTMDSGTGGIARFSHQHSLLPRLGLFLGEEQRIPYDYDELLGAIAPRPVLVVQPTMDRGSVPADVRTAVDHAREIYTLYATPDSLSLYEPNDYTRLTSKTQQEVIAWMKKNLP